MFPIDDSDNESNDSFHTALSEIDEPKAKLNSKNYYAPTSTESKKEKLGRKIKHLIRKFDEIKREFSELEISTNESIIDSKLVKSSECINKSKLQILTQMFETITKNQSMDVLTNDELRFFHDEIHLASRRKLVWQLFPSPRQFDFGGHKKRIECLKSELNAARSLLLKS